MVRFSNTDCAEVENTVQLDIACSLKDFTIRTVSRRSSKRGGAGGGPGLADLLLLCKLGAGCVAERPALVGEVRSGACVKLLPADWVGASELGGSGQLCVRRAAAGRSLPPCR